MDATAFSLFRHHPKLTNPTSFLLGEYVCRLPYIGAYKLQSLQPSSSILRAWGSTRDSPSLRRLVLGRGFLEDDNRMHKPSDDKSLNRERLIALFKRIQTEISEGEPKRRKQKRSPEPSDDSSVETSVLDFLQQSSTETKVKTSKEKRNAESTRKRRTAKKEKPRPIEQVQPPPENKPTRLPSNFMKKSPIPSPKPLQSNDLVLTDGEVPSSEANGELVQIEAMKLHELKELAKERGIRGYSKLKKSELVELLRSQVNA